MFPAELRADPGRPRDRHDPGFQRGVAEGAAVFVAGGREGVEVFGRRQFQRLHARLGARAADHERQMIRRAGAGAKQRQLVRHEPVETLRVEQGLRFLEKIQLVRRPSALRHEEEFVLGAGGRHDVDLRRQVGAGVGFAPEVEWRNLGITEVFLREALVHAARDPLRGRWWPRRSKRAAPSWRKRWPCPCPGTWGESPSAAISAFFRRVSAT